MAREPRPFQPLRYSDTAQVVRDWGHRLVTLQGQKLMSMHAQWDAAIPEPAGWWVNGPVFLTFERSQLELYAYCCEFSVSVDTCDFDPTSSEGDDGESIHVIWRESPWPEAENCRGQRLLGLAAVEGHFDGMSKFKE